MAHIKFAKPYRQNKNYYIVNIYIDGLNSGKAGSGSTPARAKAAAKRKLKGLGRK